MAPKFNKLHVVYHFLQEHPKFRRYACDANCRIVSDSIKGKDGWFYENEQESYLPLSIVEDTVVRVKHQLADAFVGPVSRWLASHPEYAQLDANRQVLLRTLEAEGATSTDSLEEILTDALHEGHPHSLQGSLIFSAEYIAERGQEEQRKALAEKLVARLAPLKLDGKDKPADRRRVEQRRKREEQIRVMSLDELKALREERRLRESDPTELHAALKAEGKQRQEANSQFLPFTIYVPPGKTEAEGIPLNQLTFALYRRLPVVEQKRLLKLYGPDQINAALRNTQQES